MAENSNKKIKFVRVDEPYLQKLLDAIQNSEHAAARSARGILALAAVGGIVGIGAIAPNILKLLQPRCSKKHSQLDKERFRDFCRTLARLEHKKILSYVRTDSDGELYCITKLGKKKLRKFILDSLSIPLPVTWDGQWRVLIFDIPHDRKTAREALRDKIKELGFFQLQKSVWLYPFPYEEELLYIADVFKIKNFVEILTVTSITNKRALQFFYPLLRKYHQKY